MRERLLRTGLFALCALVPVGLVLSGAVGSQPEDVRASETVIPLGGGMGADYFPDVELTTHEGERVRFYSDLIKDKIVVINFMYARCEGTCPGTTANLVKVQRMLGDLVGSEIHMYSITLKPEEDDPRALRDYARAFGVGPGWTFLTGAPEDVEQLRQALGFTDPDPELDADTASHIGMVLYGDEAHQQWAACPCLLGAELMVEQILWLIPEEKHPAALREARERLSQRDATEGDAQQ